MRQRTRFLGFLAGVAAVAALGLETAPAAAGDITTCPPGEDCNEAPIMDAQIAKTATGPFVGVGVYDESGAEQIVFRNIKPGKTKSFYLRADNVGDAGEAHFVATGGSPPCYRIRYFYSGNDLTASLTAGLTGGVLASSAPVYQLEIKAKGCAVPGQIATTYFDVSPTTGGLDHDRVRARLIIV
jgi:hypothetical protein